MRKVKIIPVVDTYSGLEAQVNEFLASGEIKVVFSIRVLADDVVLVDYGDDKWA